MKNKKDFEVPLSRSACVIATVEMLPSTRINQIVVHPVENLSPVDKVTVKITAGNTIVYSGALEPKGMVITPDSDFFPQEDLRFEFCQISVWESIMMGNEDITSLSADEHLCRVTLVTTDEPAEVLCEEVLEFDSAFVSDWA